MRDQELIISQKLIDVSRSVLAQSIADAIAAAKSNGVELSANALIGLAAQSAEFYFSAYLQGE